MFSTNLNERNFHEKLAKLEGCVIEKRRYQIDAPTLKLSLAKLGLQSVLEAMA